MDTNKNIAKYKCYNHKKDILEIPLKTDEDTFFKHSEDFLNEVLRL